MAIYYNGHLQSTKGGGSSSGGGGIDYSTTEQNTGLKWIDGKPIYRRTFDFSIDDLVNGGISSDVQYGEFDIDSYFTDAKTIWIDQSNSFIFGSTTIVSQPINYPSGSSFTKANVQRSTRNSHLIIYFENNYSASEFYTDRALLHYIFTIQYTKTTDTV
jgi:hypothetical protein